LTGGCDLAAQKCTPQPKPRSISHGCRQELAKHLARSRASVWGDNGLWGSSQAQGQLGAQRRRRSCGGVAVLSDSHSGHAELSVGGRHCEGGSPCAPSFPKYSTVPESRRLHARTPSPPTHGAPYGSGTTSEMMLQTGPADHGSPLRYFGSQLPEILINPARSPGLNADFTQSSAWMHKRTLYILTRVEDW